MVSRKPHSQPSKAYRYDALSKDHEINADFCDNASTGETHTDTWIGEQPALTAPLALDGTEDDEVVTELREYL